MLTQAEIDALIACQKRVTAPMKRDMRDQNGHKKNGFSLESEDGRHKFSCFIRVLTRFPENFSIGLTYLMPDGGSLILLRCNGDHGLHQNFVRDDRSFEGYHIHMATEEALELDCSVENFAEPTDAYASWQEALHHFLKAVNVVDAASQFPMTFRQVSILERLGVSDEQLS